MQDEHEPEPRLVRARTALHLRHRHQLKLQSSTEPDHVKLAGTQYRLQALRGMAGSQSPQTAEALAGYRVDAEAWVGAVEVFHPGRVWLARTLPEASRHQLSCLFVGLLLNSTQVTHAGS